MYESWNYMSNYMSNYMGLVDAVIRGNLDEVKRIGRILGYPYKGDMNKDEETVIRFAAVCGHLQMLKWLIQKDTGKKYRTQYAINVATQHGHLHIVQDLAAVESVNRADVVWLGASSGNVHIVKWMFQTYPELKDMSKTSAFMHAASRGGNVNVIEFFHSVLPDAKSALRTSFIDAAKGRHVKAMDWLARKGAIDRVKDASILKGILLNAAGTGDIDCVKWLVNYGAPLKEPLILYRACSEGSFDVAKFLADQGADPAVINRYYRDRSKFKERIDLMEDIRSRPSKA